VKRADKRHVFDSVLLVTPNDGLSDQHLNELQRSGVDAVLLVEDRSGQRTFQPRVRVIEISKLAEEASDEGASVPLESPGSANLVFVYQGHKGTGSKARRWQNRPQVLGKDGFILEYSATFAQAIGSFLESESGFEDAQTKGDLFKPMLDEIAGCDGERLYREICQRLFHGTGGLEVWELKSADGELALRVSASSGRERPCFAVINIGDVSAFKKHLEENLKLKLDVHEDNFSRSLFGEIDRPDSSR